MAENSVIYQKSVFLSTSSQNDWLIQTNYAHGHLNPLLLARASRSFSKKVKVLNTKLFF